MEARISHLAYAPEIAHAMLQRQQASAVIAARQKIVEGAVGMVEMALQMLSHQNIVELDNDKKADDGQQPAGRPLLRPRHPADRQRGAGGGLTRAPAGSASGTRAGRSGLADLITDSATSRCLRISSWNFLACSLKSSR